MLSPLLFIIVMEAVTHSVREGLPWEMLYADDLVLVGKCEEELKEKLRKWNECLKDKGLKINEGKTKVMCESFGTGTTQVVGNVKHPWSVCVKGVGVNSIRCTQCVQWVHARCSRVKGSLKNVESSFICRRCNGELCKTRQVNSLVNGLLIDGHEYEIVDKLCYLGDMLSQEGGCKHAILKRVQTGWLKFSELSGLLIGKGTSLRAKGIIYTTCIRPAMLYGSETWPTKIEDKRKIQRSEMRMLRWMTGVSLSERKSNECVRSMLAIDDVAEVMRRNRLRWFGHVERRDELCWLKRIETLQVDGDGVKGRPKKRWREVLREDMREKGLCREDAWDRSRWRRMLWEGHR